MAYNPRYIFNFASDNGTDYRIVISQRDYSGSAVQRALGRTPILKRETGEGGICGTSLEIYAECAVDGEFADLYTSDATEFHVALQVSDDSSYTTVWDGFVSPELYSEPDIAPPYDVQIIATDGLGELKLSEFVPAGRNTIWYYLKQILTLAGFNDTVAISESDYILVSSLKVTTPQVTPANLFTGLQIDPEHLSDKTNYEALESILGTFHMRVCRYMGKWVFWRETDTDIQSAVIPAAHGSSLPSVAYGSMATHTWWPVGNTSTEIVPAKRKTVAKLPYHRRDSMFDNPHLKDNTGWNTDGTVVWVDWGSGASRPMLAPLASISQAISVEATASDLVLRILTGSANTEGSPATLSYAGRWKIQIHGSVDRWLLQTSEGAEWVEEETYNPFAHTIVQVDSPTDWSVENFDAIEVTLPPIPVGGTLSITVDNALAGLSVYIFAVGGIFLQQSEVPGYKDTVNISNGARGDDSEAEMAFGDAPDTTNILRNFSNIITAGSSTPTSMWAKGSGTSMALVRLIALDHALSVALPRLRTKGKLNIPAGSFPPFALVSPEGLTLIPESWSWRIVDDELDFEATSVPATSLTVQSETMTEMTPSEAASSTGGSAASGGRASGGSYVDRYFTDQIEDDQVVGAKALRDLYITQEEADEQQGTPEVTKNITEILRHLRLETVTDALGNQSTILVSNITFASEKNTVAGWSGGSGGGSGGGTGGGSIATLADVTLTDLTDRNILRYDALSSHWVNEPLSLSLGELSDVALGTPLDGQSLVYDATAGKWKPVTVGGGGYVTVISNDATIGTALTTLGTINGTPIKAKIAEYLEISQFTASNIVDALGTTAVNRSTADASGNVIKTYYAANLVYASNSLQLKNGNNTTLATITGANILGMLGLNTTDTIATQAWVGNQGYLTSSAISDMATKTWVGQQGYLTASSISDMATKTWVGQQGYLTSSALSGYMLASDYTGNGTSVVNRAKADADGNIIKNYYAANLVVSGTDLLLKNGGNTTLSTITGANIVTVIGNNAVARATADASGNAFSTAYLRKNVDDTMSANLTIGADGSTKSLMVYGSGTFSTSLSVGSDAIIGGNVTVGAQTSTSTAKTLTVYGRNNSTNPALVIVGVVSSSSRYSTTIYRDASALQIVGDVFVSGNFKASGYNNAGASASDRRLKTDIRSISLREAADLLSVLKPVVFRWNQDAEHLSEGGLKGVSRGFLADEFLDVLPNAGRKMWEKYDAICYEQVIPYLVAGWQQQNLRIRILEGEISSLKDDNELMRRRLREANVLR